MSRLPSPLRLLLLFLALCLPLAAIGAIEAGGRGAAVAAALILLFIPVVAFRLETGISRSFPGASEAPEGLKRSFERAAPAHAGQVRLLVYADSLPNAAVFRALGGPGTIAVSRGLVSTLSEAELRAVLATCAARSREGGIVIRSLCAQLAIWTLALIPRAWLAAIQGRSSAKRPLTPIGALAFSLVFPLASFFVRAGGNAAATEGTDAYLSATRKISDAISRWGFASNPGTVRLFLVAPWSRQMLLPFA